MNVPHTEQTSRELPIACTLTGEDRGRRADEIAGLLSGRQEVRQLHNGYALRFPGEEPWATRLLAFILGERACCPFFTFELLFEPEHGPLWLHICGPAGTEEFVVEMLIPAREQAE